MTDSVIFRIEELAERLGAGRDERYLEFLRVPGMNAGLYVLKEGERDPQRPHAEDEIYHVIAGMADFRAEDRTTTVGPGSVIYVRAGVDHSFERIVEDLTILVVFAAGPDRATRRSLDIPFSSD